MCIILFPTVSFSAPHAPCNPVTIEGTVEEAYWVPAQFVKGKPGGWGSTRQDRTFQAHYKVKLAETTVTSTNSRDLPYCGGSNLKIIHDQDDGYLQGGMRIKVIEYISGGDEGGDWSSFNAIEISR